MQSRTIFGYLSQWAFLGALSIVGCDKDSSPNGTSSAAVTPRPSAAAAKPAPRRTGQNTVVDVALGSKDHTTLVAALGGAEYVDSLDNAGPFTVFAPTNAAFEKVPPGTVEGLMKPDKQDALRNILKYHVTVSIYEKKGLADGQVLAMANGAKATVHLKDGKFMINNANVVASVMASNGVVHVIDAVLLPPESK